MKKTVQRTETATEMTHTPPKRPLSSSSTKPHGDFNWPPTDEELAQCFVTLQSETAPDGTGAKTAEPLEAPISRALDATFVIPSETLAQPADPAIVGETALMQADPGRSDEADPKHFYIEDSMMSGSAVAQTENALAETSTGEMAAEIAHLQALIEGLTQKVEWRITNVIGR